MEGIERRSVIWAIFSEDDSDMAEDVSFFTADTLLYSVVSCVYFTDSLCLLLLSTGKKMIWKFAFHLVCLLIIATVNAA